MTARTADSGDPVDDPSVGRREGVSASASGGSAKAPSPARFSIRRRLGRRWTLLVAVLVIAVAGFAVYRLQAVFASQDVVSTPSAAANEIVPFNPKHVVLDVFGPPGTMATITYLDVNAQPQRAEDVPLPWAYDATTTQPSVFVNVAAQGDATSIGCRITIDDVVKDSRTVTTLNAYAFCLDKSG